MASCDFWLFPKLKMPLKGTPIWVKRRHYAERDSPAEHDSTGSFPEMFPAMAGPLEEVCALQRRLLWRGLGFQTSKLIIVFLPTKGPILFEQTSYLQLHNHLHFHRTSHFVFCFGESVCYSNILS
jgi:hypothetical protein